MTPIPSVVCRCQISIKLGLTLNLNSAFRLNQCLFRDHRPAVWTVGQIRQDEFVWSTPSKNVAENPIEGKLSFLASTVLTAGNPTLCFQNRFGIDGDQLDTRSR